MVDEQDFDLTQQIFRPHRLNQQRLCALPLPLAAESRKCRKNGGGGIVGLFARGANHLVAGMLGFHLHIGDDHVILGRLQLALGFGGGGGGLHFEPVDFENSFQREQDREFIIDQQDAAFHGALQGTRFESCNGMQAAATLVASGIAHWADFSTMAAMNFSHFYDSLPKAVASG